MATSWSTEGESEVPIAQHLEVHRRQQRLVGAHDRITDGPGPRSNAMHTPTPTGIAVAALVGLLCAGSAPLLESRIRKTACLGAQASQQSPHSGWWRSESDQQLLKCSGKPAACASRPVHRTWPMQMLGSG